MCVGEDEQTHIAKSNPTNMTFREITSRDIPALLMCELRCGKMLLRAKAFTKQQSPNDGCRRGDPKESKDYEEIQYRCHRWGKSLFR
jgi:hypothetical protein